MTVTNLTPPVITGTAKQGQTLHTSNGTWDYDLEVLDFAYRWLRCDAAGANCVAITGATSSGYLLTAADVGSTVRSEVTATEHAGTPLPPESGPMTISTGGTYLVNVVSPNTTAAITVTTTQPVTITGSVKNLFGGILINAIPGGAVQLTLDHLFGYGGSTYQTSGRFIEAEGFQSIVIENCTVEHTRGIELQGLNSPASSSVRVRYNRFTDIKGGPDGNPVGNFIQFRFMNNTQSAEVAWNEVINTFVSGNPGPEDGISVYKSSHVNAHDNYLQGGYPVTVSDVYSGTGVVLSDSSSATESGNNLAKDNQIVDWTNVGVGISGGHDNLVDGNRVICDGRDDSGNAFYTANVGIVCYVTTPGKNNRLINNYVGWMQGQRFGHPLSRADTYTPTADNNVEAQNTFVAGNHTTPITHQMELDEFTFWQNKVANAGVTIGA